MATAAVLRLDDMPGTGPPLGGAEGVIAMRRIAVIVALGALLGLVGGVVTASPALARGPKWTFLDFGKHFTESACGTEIQGTQLVDRVFVKTLKTADGTMISLFTGAAKITFTNPENGKSITVNTSGPLKEIDFPDGSATFLGKGLQPVNLGPADAERFGLPAFFVSAGALTGTADANGNLTSLSLHGHVLVDLCAALG